MRFYQTALRQLCWGFALATALCASALSQTAVTDFKAGPANGSYSFASSTPKLLPELFKPLNAEPVNIVGHLFVPAGDAKVGAVILMHGSGGIYDAMLDFWPKQFNAAGLAVFSIDSFGPRGVKSTADDQSQVPFAADIADAYAALRVLATHPRIDASRIVLMGFSRGGITTWRSALTRVTNAQAAAGARFAAFVPVYSGGCTGMLRVSVKPGVFGKAPMLWLHGDADDYTPIGPCKDMVKRIADAGTSAEFVTIAGAGHKFDMDEQRRIFVRGAQRSLETCTLEFDVDSLSFTDTSTGQRLSGQEAVAFNRSKCGATGANVEGSQKARTEAASAITAFLKRALP
jgi:dienelactone hydrolase